MYVCVCAADVCMSMYVRMGFNFFCFDVCVFYERERERGGVWRGADKREKYCDIDNRMQIFREIPFFRPQNDT